MGQALAPVDKAPAIERYEAAAFNPFAASGLHYSVQRQASRVFHHEWGADPKGKVVAESVAEVQFAVGSATHGRAYLINHDGYLFQSPITWYPQDQRWDLSPSYARNNLHFGRLITLGCLFCHCNQAEPVAHTVNRYRQPIFQGYAIGCERCHGPGELHVKRRADGEVVDGLDDSIVNPARLDHSLREAVCQQCHLQGEQRVVARGRLEFDFRPGLPLDLFQMDFVKGGGSRDDLKFVSSVEQMVASRCYRASEDPVKLGCISCHDPHRLPAPEEKVAYFRKRCLNCHTEKACNLPPVQRLEKSKEDSCIACHMPRTGSEISHTSITDHRIPRRAEQSAPGIAPSRAPPGPSQLVPFQSDIVDLKDEEASRNYGVALVAMLERKPPEAIARQFSYKALPLLERALK